MEYLTKLTKSIFITSFILLLYGYLCRIVGLYFFWESKTIGWTLFLLALIFFLSNRITFKKKSKRKTVVEKILIGVLIFVLLVQIIVFISIPKTDAYATAKQYLLTNQDIKAEFGEINGFFLKPTGSMSINSSAQGESGEAELDLIVKGSKKFKDVSLYVSKSITTDWNVQAIR